MSERQSFYGGPLSDTPLDVKNNPSALLQSKSLSKKSIESVSDPTPCHDQLATLKRQIAELERERTHLVKLTLDSNQRVYEAEKRVAIAEAETTAAKQRAQDRYTEKLHANNEARHLREAIRERDAHRRVYMTRVDNCFIDLKANFIAYKNRTEKSIKDLTNESQTKISVLEEQLNDMQNGFLASQNEKAAIKTECEKAIKELKKVIMSQQSSLTKAEEAEKSARAAMEDLQAKIEENEKLLKIREADSIESNELKIKDAEAQWRAKLQSMQNKIGRLEKQTEQAKKQAESAKQELQMAVRTMRNNTQTCATQQQQQQQQHHHRHRGEPLQQTCIPNKKRKLISNGTANVGPPGVQPTLSLTGATQHTMRGTNGAIEMMNTPEFWKQPPTRVPNGGNGTYPVLRPNVSNGLATPLLPLQQQNYSKCDSYFTQSRRPMVSQQTLGYLPAQQQATLLQSVILNDTGTFPQGHLQKPQDVPLVFDMGVAQQSFQGIGQAPMNPFLLNHTAQANGTDAAFMPTSQTNGILSASEIDDVMAGLNS